MPQARYFSSGAVDTTLAGDLNGSATTAQVADLTGWPPDTPFTAVIDPDSEDRELVLVTGVAGTTLTVVRGFDGTAPVPHATGARVQHVAVGRDFNDLHEHRAATSAHGTSGSVVGTTDAQVLTNKSISSADNDLTVAMADVTGLGDALDDKANVEHSHEIEDIVGLDDSLDAKANAADVQGRRDIVVACRATPHNHGVDNAALLWDETLIDSTGDMHSTTSNTSRLYARKAGVYRLTWEVIAYGLAGSWRRLQVRKNGSVVSFGPATSFNSHPTQFYGHGHLSGSVTLALAANDYVELYLDEQDADSLIINEGSTLTLEQLVA